VDAAADRVRKITGGGGVDRIVEVDIAGSATLVPKIIAQDGLCAAYGSNAAQACFDFGPMILGGAAVPLLRALHQPRIYVNTA
jgi:NADPH2:quinone reductase